MAAIVDNLRNGARRFSFIILTILVMGGFFAYYFFVVVQNNEQLMVARHYRGLFSMANSISNKADDYRNKNANNFLTKITNSDPISEEERSVYQDVNNNFIKSQWIAAIQNQFQMALVDTLPADDSLINHTGDLVFKNDWNFIYYTNKGTATYKAADFIKPLLRQDLFDEYIVVCDGHLIYQDRKINLEKSDLDQLSSASKIDVDTVKNISYVKTNQLIEVEIGGQRYKLFIQPFQDGKQHNWVIGGLMTTNEYNLTRTHISGNYLLALIFGIIIVILCLPFLKVYLMNSKETFSTEDIIYSFVSFSLIGGLLSIGIWNFYSFRIIDKSQTDDNLSRLSASITNSFVSEVDSAFNLMTAIDNAFNMDSALAMKGDCVFSGASNGDSKLLLSTYPFFKNIAWVDKSGNQTKRWTRDKIIPPKTSVKERNYFNKINDDQGWIKDTLKNQFYVDEITSWNTGEKLAVVSKKHIRHISTKMFVPDLTKVVNLSSVFKSVIDPIIPQGYGFALVSTNGKVLFHSNSSIDGNENIIDELENPVQISEAIRSRNIVYADDNYMGHDQRLMTRPIPNMPFSLITFYNKEEASNKNIQIISTSTLLNFINFTIIMLVVVFLLMFSQQTSKLRRRRLNLSVLFPKRENASEYLSLILFQIYCVILVFAFNDPDDELLMFGIVLLSSISIVNLSFYLLSIRPKTQKLYYGLNSNNVKLTFFNMIKLFVSSLMSIEGENQLSRRTRRHLVKRLFLLYLPLFISTIVLIGIFFSIQSMLQFPYELWLFAGALIAGIFLVGFTYKYIRQIKRFGFQIRYMSFQAGFVVATAIAPSVIFYQTTYLEESKLENKHLMLNLCQELTEKSKTGNKNDVDKEFDYTNNKFGFTSFYTQPVADTVFSASDSLQKLFALQNKLNKKKNAADQLYSDFRPMFSKYSIVTNDKISDHSADQNFMWNYNDVTKVLQFFYFDFRNGTGLKNRGIIISSMIQPLQKFNEIAENPTTDTLLFYLFLFVATCLWIRFIFSYLSRICFPKISYSEFTSTEATHLAVSTSHKENVFIVGLPKSGKASVLSGFPGEKIFNIEFTEIGLKTWDERIAKLETFLETASADKDAVKPIVLVRHFEYNLTSKDDNTIKLKLLEKILYCHYVRMVVLSTIHPMEFFNDAQDGENTWDKDVKNRWINLMSNFYTSYFPINNDSEFPVLNQNSKMDFESERSLKRVNENIKTSLGRFVMRECGHGSFLRGLRYEILLSLTNEEIATNNHEDVVIRITNLANVYFMSLWLSLNANEKRVLFDLAEDLLVNPENIHEIETLCNKGVVCYHNGMLSVMNHSFRHFVNNLQSENDIKQWVTIANDTGTWNKLRYPIIIVLVLVAGFIFITQKEAFNSMLAYFTAFSGGIMGIMKLSSFLPQANKNNG